MKENFERESEIGLCNITQFYLLSKVFNHANWGDSMDNSKVSEAMVLLSKFEIPSLPVSCFHRDSLLERIEHVSLQKLTLVASPIGYGKTTSLSMFARCEGRIEQTVWLSCDEEDNDPKRFWLHVYRSLGMDGAFEIGDNCFEHLSMSLYSQYSLKQNFYFIIDNYDRINNEEIDEGILRFIALLPGNLHVFVLARSFSDRMIAASQSFGCFSIGIDDLRYSANEIEAVARQSILKLEETQIREIAKAIFLKTDGWPQGVSMAFRQYEICAKREHEFAFSGSSGLVKCYFSSIILPQIPASLEKVIFALTPFERFSFEFCKEALRMEIDLKSFEWLTRGGIVLVEPCDEEDVWYRYNGLFLDWLCSCINDWDEGTIRANCLYASIWHAEKQNKEESAKYFLLASDFEYVEHVVESICGLIRPSKEKAPFTWLIETRSQTYASSPLMCELSAWAYNAGGRIGDALAWSNQFESAAIKSGCLDAEIVEFAVDFMGAKCLAMGNDGTATLTKCESLLAKNKCLSPSPMSVIYQSMGEAYERLGDYKQAKEAYLRAIAYAKVGGEGHHRFFNRASYAEACYIQGHLQEAFEEAEKMLSECPKDFSFNALANSLLAMICFDRNQVEEGQHYANLAMLKVNMYRNCDIYLKVYIAQTALLLASGDKAEAFALITEAIVRVGDLEIPRVTLLNAYYWQALVAFYRKSVGDLQLIKEQFLERVSDADEFHQVRLLMIDGYICETKKDFFAAVNKYDEVADRARKRGYARVEILALVYCVRIWKSEGIALNANSMLSRIIELVQRHELVRPVVSGGPFVREALRDYVQKHSLGVMPRMTAKSLLVAFEKELHGANDNEAFASAGENLEQLTKRESEILHLLNMGMTRQEISDVLVISINTVKKHLSNIYAKLGVATKEEALESIADKNS